LLNSVVEGAHRINAIVIGLKNFARDEKTCLDLPVDINKVIEAALAMIHNQIRKHTEKFQSFLGDKLPPVTGSFQQLEQVVVNLVMNALQALRNRSEGVIISSSFASDRDEVTIEVKDEGVGISEDTLQVIFDPFFTTKLETGGTGLGLSICFSIVKDHGGIIECKSEPGSGSVFLVRIPVKQKRK
jgi:C4-dicarboxylate-specific signal transduction histidine kinase